MLRPSRHYRTYDGDALVANACLKVEGSSLVAVDSLGGVHRFPLDGGPKAPAVVAHVVHLTPSPYSDLSALAVFDGEGKALVTAPHDAFDPMGAGIFARTARLRYELRNIETEEQFKDELQRRQGCVELRSLPPLSVSSVTVFSLALITLLTVLVLVMAGLASWWLLPASLAVVLCGHAAWTRRPSEQGAHL